ncbi:MAG: guanine nucleotide binding protein, alpha subunit [Lentinula lateritia]|uniref:Guanine nucleotide binding protein, alpha subunit n=1 Tax=Lentinula lateritia TaxID=40482 RepID=A0ABQ8VJA1_9AGAR|nr:MAG: guanine nucleotide binding protein, alpha subunit [Lentinula lateritia]KAJ4494493.1 guanine nucleotide binding protein, alpha subunit [Lentinula lateritia]
MPAAVPIAQGRSSSAPASIEGDSGVLLPANRFYDEESQRISNLIDEELRKESQKQREARRKQVKVMLLGQAESGKSTLQKQFQIYYASQSLDRERPFWKPVVHFNIIRAVKTMLEEIDYELSQPEGEDSGVESDLEYNEPGPSSAGPSSSSNRRHNKSKQPSAASEHVFRPSANELETLSVLRTRLLPLVALHDSLASELSGGVSFSRGLTGVFVRAGWQGLLQSNPGSRAGKGSVVGVAGLAAKALDSSREDIQALWAHSSVKELIQERKLKLEESAPFFLDNVARIAEPDYLPNLDDVLNVRLQTLGVIEHSFPINLGGTMYDWRLYDVGGARGQRHAWIPYFEDATAIIFLAPISAFDQYLEEDPRTNRIDDSLQLFTTICSNKLLKKAHLVLMLNKTDLLKAKLKAGIRVQKYITSYGSRPNKYDDVASYFRAHFMQVHKKKDVSNRSLYLHFTSMLDIKATQNIIVNVGEAIIRQHIAQTGLT